MPLRVENPELFGVTESSLTLTFEIWDNAGPVAAPAAIALGGEVRAVSPGAAGTRHVRVEGLEPSTSYSLEIQVEGAASPEPARYFPESVETLPASDAHEVASFATLNDLHFGEPRFGGTLLADGEFGEEKSGFNAVHETDAKVPYWQLMNEDAVADINALGVDATFIKGDIADRGLPEQFEIARRTFEGFKAPHHAFLGNHDHYGLLVDQEVDGYALLQQPAAPRAVDLGGWRMLLLDTVEPGEHHGVFPDDRLRWLTDALGETRESGIPTLVLTHHQPVPPEHFDRYPNSIGLIPEHSLRVFDLLGEHPQVKGVLIGHTHRNRVRCYPSSGRIPFVEVHCVKDYPGGFAHYRLFDDGHFRQEARRTSSERALEHSTRCSSFFDGGYRHFALGSLENRSYIAGP
jgi:hypothetical protein